MSEIPARDSRIICDICGEVVYYSERSCLNIGIIAHNTPRAKWTYLFPFYKSGGMSGNKRTDIRWDFHTDCVVQAIKPHLRSGVPQ